MMGPTKEEEKCAVCGSGSTKFCSACNKVYYCTPSHQKSHWKTHKPHCYPAILKEDLNLGRYLVASRNIKVGSVIFKDKAVVSGPSASEIVFHKICLGCYRVVVNPYKCSNCHWPVCNEKCEKMAHHAQFECKIFAENKVAPYFTKSHQYDDINFLRSLLLKMKDERKWAEIAQLSSQSEARAKNLVASLSLKTTVEFITHVCQLTEFQLQEIDHVVGVWGINSFGANPPTANPNTKYRLATLLFPKLCLASHNCIPNTRGVLLEDKNSSKPMYTMELLAASPIKIGEQIHTTYANVTEGTYERRLVLRDNYYFSCDCERCKDATEFGTFYSAFKCQSCSNGNLLPRNALDFNSAWKCSGCGALSSYSELSHPLLSKIKCELDCISQEANFQSINQLEKILTTYQDVALHRNHWLMLEVECRLLHRIVGFLPMARGVREESLVNRIVNLAEHCLSIANILQPGHTTFRGKLLYCLSQAKLQEIIRFSQGIGGFLGAEQIKTLKKIAEESSDILCKEPDGSEEKVISNLLKDDLNQIGKLEGLMKLQRNANLFI